MSLLAMILVSLLYGNIQRENLSNEKQIKELKAKIELTEIKKEKLKNK